MFWESWFSFEDFAKATEKNIILTVPVHFAPLATRIPKHTRHALGNLCFVSVPKNWTQNVWKISVHHCGQTAQTLMHFYSDDLWPVWQQRQRSPCYCTGSCCSGRTGPWGISSTTPVRASGNARRTWVVKSSTTSTRARQVNFYSFTPVLTDCKPVFQGGGMLKAHHFWPTPAFYCSSLYSDGKLLVGLCWTRHIRNWINLDKWKSH